MSQVKERLASLLAGTLLHECLCMLACDCPFKRLLINNQQRSKTNDRFTRFFAMDEGFPSSFHWAKSLDGEALLDLYLPLAAWRQLHGGYGSGVYGRSQQEGLARDRTRPSNRNTLDLFLRGLSLRPSAFLRPRPRYQSQKRGPGLSHCLLLLIILWKMFCACLSCARSSSMRRYDTISLRC